MRAALFQVHGGPEVLELGQLPDPSPGPGQVVVEVRAVALNHLDLWVRSGIPGLKLSLPHVGGSEVAGVVAELGCGVEDWCEGDRVVVNPSLWCGRCEWCARGEHPLCRRFRVLGEHAWGGTAERVAVAARNLYPLPVTARFEEAAAAPLVFQTAWRALITRARLRPGETVLITGASGGVSTAAIQIARLAGASVFALTSGAENVRRASELGAHRAIDRLSEDFVQVIREETEGRFLDVILDSVGEALWNACVRCLARGGRLVTYGGTTGAVVGLDVRHVFWKQLEIIGTTMGTRGEFERTMDLLFAGRLRPVVDVVWPLERIRDAHRRLESGEGFGKIVLIP